MKQRELTMGLQRERWKKNRVSLKMVLKLWVDVSFQPEYENGILSTEVELGES